FIVRHRWGAARRRRRGRGSRGRSGHSVLNLNRIEARRPLPMRRPPDAHPVLSSLHLELGDTTLIHYANQFTNLFNSHLETGCWISDVGFWLLAIRALQALTNIRHPKSKIRSYISRSSLDVGVRTSHPVLVITTVSSMR